MGLFAKFKEKFIPKKEKIESILEETLEDSILEETAEEVLEEQIVEAEPEVLLKEKKKKKTKETKLTEEEQTIVTYDKGLEKTRKEFVSELTLLGKRFTKVTDDYYDELENILIKADIGVRTVVDFIDRLRSRVKSENITDLEYLNEVIVDELFMICKDGIYIG